MTEIMNQRIADGLLKRNKLKTEEKTFGEREKKVSSGGKNRLDLSNQRFGRLIAVRSRSIFKPYYGRFGQWISFWLCRCDCGRAKLIRAGNLVSGNTISCGCFKSELDRDRGYCLPHYRGKKNPMFGRRGDKSPIFGKSREDMIGERNWVFGKPAWNRGKPGLSGDKHSLWNGGTSFLPYPSVFNGSLKKLIRQRDNGQCQNPECGGEFSYLTIHHIDYDKENCHPLNLVTLCNSCNSKANSNRQKWKQLYREIVRQCSTERFTRMNYLVMARGDKWN